jgi:hypothetical protein
MTKKEKRRLNIILARKIGENIRQDKEDFIK